MRNEITTKQLYEKLLEMPDLHSLPQLDGENLFWSIYKDAYIRAYCDSYDACIEINGTSAWCSVMHWHPDEKDMFDQLYSLGKKGNMLVLKQSLFGTSVFYIGSPENYPLSDGRQLYFGRKWGDGGQLLYFEQK